MMSSESDALFGAVASKLVCGIWEELDKSNICVLAHICENRYGNRPRNVEEERVYSLVMMAHEFYHAIHTVREVTGDRAIPISKEIN